MLKWLQNNPVGMALGGVGAFFLLLLLILLVLGSLPISTDIDEEDGLADEKAIELPALAESKPVENYKVIIERPLFNQSRQPIIEEQIDNPEDDFAEDGSDFDMPSVELMGVVITPTEKMVTLKQADSGESLVAYEGRPIEANFGSWRVSSVGPRTATLTSADGEELLLELKVHDASIEEPPPLKPVAEAGEAEAATAANDSNQDGESLSRADEIRRRIAERREELQKESENNQQATAEANEPTYKDAIRNLISRNRNEEAENDNN